MDAPIIVDAADHFYKQPMYYAMAHFSKYVTPGSRRIKVTSTATGVGRSPMECGAFLRPDGLVALVVLNRGHLQLGKGATTQYSVQVGAARWINLDVPAHSFQTILVKP